MRSRLRELRVHLLPASFSPTGDYTDRQLDRARGYRLLAHAEFESYLEDIVKDAATHAIQQWKNQAKPSYMLIAFLSAYHSGWNPDDINSNEEIIRLAQSRKKVKESISEVIDAAQTKFRHIINANHGIQEKNFRSLTLPIGIEIDSLDNTWLSNLYSFGRSRGEVAHNTKRATSQISPLDEFNNVKGLLEGFKELDEKIFALIQSC